MNRTARNYLRAVKRKIPLRDMRSHVLETLKPACEAFEAEHPDADRTEYYERFGTPQMIAKDALENTETDVLYRGLTRSRRIWIIALVAAALMVIGFGICLAIASVDAHRSANGYFEEELFIVDYDEDGNLTYLKKVD